MTKKSRLQEIREIRLEKVEKLRSMGINPYPARSTKDFPNNEIVENYEKHEGKSVTLTGRLMSWREHGNIAFGHIQDESGQIQLFIQKKLLTETSKEKQTLGFKDAMKLLDVGDFVQATGEVGKTVRGEVSLLPTEIRVLTKSIRPLPEKWVGIKDEEKRYRRRYVDLILNDDLKEMFRKKSIFWNSIRSFMIENGFLEVETPVLETTAGGADATPFETHHNALDMDLFLRISMGELWQKRLMVAGFEKTFEIGRQFRNEGISREHLQDYTQMEFYWAYANYQKGMELVEKMYKYVAEKTFGTLEFSIGEFNINLSKDWEIIDFTKILIEKTGIDVSKASKKEISQKLKDMKVSFSDNDSKGRLMDILWKQVRKDIAGPAFLTGHPVEVSPLAKRQPDNENFVERYQVILAGSEMGNGYSELNDPVDQGSRFEEQQQMRDEGDDEAQMHDKDFVEALEFGMPPTNGFGVSERLFSFLADVPIREAVLFPLLRREKKAKKVEK